MREAIMKDAMQIYPAEISRRCLLRRAACAAGAAVILGTGVNSAMAGKMPQAAVRYQGSPKGSQSCANCRLFQAPSACKSVDGTVSGSGWCTIYVPA
jgi:high potential iron-sulfur protein